MIVSANITSKNPTCSVALQRTHRARAPRWINIEQLGWSGYKGTAIVCKMWANINAGVGRRAIVQICGLEKRRWTPVGGA